MPRFNYSSALGDNTSPNAPLKRYELGTAAAIGIGAASLIGSGISAYQNLKSQADTNKTNYKIWQEQLAAQKENWKQEQENYLQNRKWQIEDRENQRLYDSPQSQKARYLAAGINPYIENSIGQPTTYNAPPEGPSFSSPASPIQMQAPQLPDLGMGISQAASAYLSAQKTETDMQYIHQKSQNETAKTIAEVEQYGKNSKYLSSLTDSLRQEMLFNQDSWNTRLHNLHADFELKTAQTNLAKATEEVQKTIEVSNKLENAFRRATNPERAKQMIAENALLSAQKALANANAKSISDLLPYQQNLMKNEFIHLMNQDAAEFEQLGINMGYLGLGQGHANMEYLGDWIDPLFKGLGTGAGIVFGLRTLGRSPLPIKGFGR